MSWFEHLWIIRYKVHDETVIREANFTLGIFADMEDVLALLKKEHSKPVIIREARR